MSEDPFSRQGSGSAFVQTEIPSTGNDQPPRPHRRRRRRRRRGGGGGGGRPGFASGAPERLDEMSLAGPERPVEGVLFLPPRENAPGVLVSARANYLPSASDPLIPRDLITREGLEAGAMITGIAADSGRPVVKRVESVEGLEPGAFRQRPTFNELISIDPHDHLQLETTSDEMCGRVVDLLAPIGRGQRCLIVAPPKAGKTTLLKRMAHAVSVNDPDVYVIVLLIDERPEEITDFRRSVRGEVIASSADLSAENHIAVAEIVAERARRLVECGK